MRIHHRTLSFAALGLSVGLVLSACAAPQPGSTEPPVNPVAGRYADAVGIQLFMWNWNSVAAECTSVLGPAGIDWVEVSPPQEHVLGDEWWTHYQPVSYQIESRLGTRAEFQNMVSTCDAAGVGIIADAVINHMSGEDSGTGWAGTEHGRKDYPGLYTTDDFHWCELTTNGQIDDYTDAEQVQTCDLVGLHDLATEKPSVRETIAAYLNDLIDLGVMGFRIDAAKHMPAADIRAIVDLLPDDTYIINEVIRGGGEPIQPEDYLRVGDVWEFDYARSSLRYFTGTGVGYAAAETRYESYAPSESAITFISNHDTERNGETLSVGRSAANFEIATAAMLADPYGKPMLYSGYYFEQRDTGPILESDGRVRDVSCDTGTSAATAGEFEAGQFICAHRWTSTLGMIRFHDVAFGAGRTDVLREPGVVGWGRGDRGFFVANYRIKDYADAPIPTSMEAGTYCDVITGGANPIVDGTCAGISVTVDAQGNIVTPIASRTAVAIHAESRVLE